MRFALNPVYHLEKSDITDNMTGGGSPYSGRVEVKWMNGIGGLRGRHQMADMTNAIFDLNHPFGPGNPWRLNTQVPLLQADDFPKMDNGPLGVLRALEEKKAVTLNGDLGFLANEGGSFQRRRLLIPDLCVPDSLLHRGQEGAREDLTCEAVRDSLRAKRLRIDPYDVAVTAMGLSHEGYRRVLNNHFRSECYTLLGGVVGSGNSSAMIQMRAEGDKPLAISEIEEGEIGTRKIETEKIMGGVIYGNAYE